MLTFKVAQENKTGKDTKGGYTGPNLTLPSSRGKVNISQMKSCTAIKQGTRYSGSVTESVHN